jgi:hypothetical protein
MGFFLENRDKPVRNLWYSVQYLDKSTRKRRRLAMAVAWRTPALAGDLTRAPALLLQWNERNESGIRGAINEDTRCSCGGLKLWKMPPRFPHMD